MRPSWPPSVVDRFAVAIAVGCVASIVAAGAPAARAADNRVKVLVLDVKSKDLSASEVETLTALITAHLSRYPQLDVLSSADVKRLVDLEAQKQSVGCDKDQCLADLAGALGAQVVFFGQAGKLGSTLVLTLNVFDARKGDAVGRQPVEARDISQLPSLVGPAVDALVVPLFTNLRASGQHVGPTGGGAAIIAKPNLANLGARAKEVFAQQEMDICVDDGDRLKWWFCDKKERYTENAFVRKYRNLTGRHELDRFEKNRNPNSMLIPGVMVGGGSGLLLLAVPVGYYTYVDKTTVPALSNTNSDGSSVGSAICITSVAIGAGLAIYGGILMIDALEFTDGELIDHSLKEPDARDAAAKYNESLADKVNAEYGAR